MTLYTVLNKNEGKENSVCAMHHWGVRGRDGTHAAYASNVMLVNACILTSCYMSCQIILLQHACMNAWQAGSKLVMMLLLINQTSHCIQLEVTEG